MAAPPRSVRLCDQQTINLIDKEAANLHLALALLPLVCLACKWPWQECRVVVCWLSVHASLSALHGFGLCRCGEFYRRHRTSIIIALQSLQLAAVSRIVPAGMGLAFELEIAAGQVTRFTLTLLLFGLGSYSLAIQCLVARLPWTAAAYFTAAGVSMTTCALVPQQAHFLRMPDVRDAALSIKSSIDTAYNIIMSLTALTTVEAAAAPSCSLLSLALWVHLLIGGLFPLYILYADHGNGTTSRRSTPTTSRQSTSAVPHQYDSYGHSILESASQFAYHCVMFCSMSMLLWALVDCLAMLFESPARYLAICV